MLTDSSFIKNQDILLHASSVIVDGKALVFLGHSSSGKSTISGLLSRQYPIIADDKVWIRKNTNGNWLTRDGSSRLIQQDRHSEQLHSDKEFPLSALIRIYKSDIPSIQKIPPKTLCAHLLDALFEVDIQRKQEDIIIVKDWFKRLADASKEIQGWHLTFRKDFSIIALIRKVFG